MRWTLPSQGWFYFSGCHPVQADLAMLAHNLWGCLPNLVGMEMPFLIVVPGAGTGQGWGQAALLFGQWWTRNKLPPGWEALGCSRTLVGSAGFRDTGLGCARRVSGKGKRGLRCSSEVWLGVWWPRGQGWWQRGVL